MNLQDWELEEEEVERNRLETESPTLGVIYWTGEFVVEFGENGSNVFGEGT